MIQYNFTCRFGVLGDPGRARVPSGDQDLLIPLPGGGSIPLQKVFSNASLGAIQLHADFTRLDLGRQPGQDYVRASDMEGLLKQLVRNPVGVHPAPELGILFAPGYLSPENDDVYGVMFDSLGGIPDDPDGGEGNLIPREGCAVFLGSILKKLSALASGQSLGMDLPTAYARQVAFTLVHEIGHLFNRQHVDPAAGGEFCFLNSSSASGPPPLGHFRFTDDEQEALCNVDNPDVAPGGSDFGTTGIWDKPSKDPRRSHAPAPDLELKISTTPDSFWPWEPIELDLVLRRKGDAHAERSVVPDQIDPGYPHTFQLWITGPDGTRRLFRTPKHYCAYERALEIGPRSPFRRDVSLFVEPGGYTFRRAGVHEVQLRLLLPGNRCVESNVLPVEIRSRAGLSRPEQHRCEDQRRLLTSAVRAFYYRQIPLDRRSHWALESLATRYGREHAGAAAMSVMGRHYAWIAAQQPSNRARWARLAEPWLEKAEDHSRLGFNRRKNARLALEQIKEDKPRQRRRR